MHEGCVAHLFSVATPLGGGAFVGVLEASDLLKGGGRVMKTRDFDDRAGFASAKHRTIGCL